MVLRPDQERTASSRHAEILENWKGAAQANKAETTQRSLMGRSETKAKMEEARRGVRNALKTSASVDDSKADEALSEFYGTWDDDLEKDFDFSDMDKDYGEESIPNRPKGAEYFFDKDLEDFSETIKELKEDEKFSAKLASLSEKYGISEREIDQLNALEKYLDRWNYADYNGSVPLGLLIAAPSARNKDKDFIVYRKGSKELEANPKWAGEDGNATVESITKFYRGEV